MPQPVGRHIPLSLPRRFIGDLMHFARQVPSVPVQRRMNLAPVVAARRAARPRPSWCAILTKAYGLVSALVPELRRAYLVFPRPHLYEHPVPIASVAVECGFGGENAVFPLRLRDPGRCSLHNLDRRIRLFKERPIEGFRSVRRLLKVSALPWPLRRLLWWAALNLSGPKRAHYLGTFGVSVYGRLGATSLHPLSPLTTTLNTGVLGEDGSLDVRIVYDHRTLDGATVARALAELERVLHGAILNELRYLQALEAA
jgi:hypothetical protein